MATVRKRSTTEDEDYGRTIATPEEARALFDRNAEILLGMSGNEFLDRYDAGEFDHVTENTRRERDILRVLELVTLARG